MPLQCARPVYADREILFQHDFENNQPGHYDRDSWIRDWHPWPLWRDSENARHEKIQVVPDPLSGSLALECVYPEGSIGSTPNMSCSEVPRAHPGGGEYFTAYFADSMGYDEVYFSYNVMFKPGFDFVKGGKLPFVAGGPVDDKGSTKPGEEDGFDCILMWSGDGSQASSGGLQFYIYHQNVPHERYAESKAWALDGQKFRFDVQALRWYNITVRVKMNTWLGGKGQPDGFIEGFIDGRFMTGMYGLEFLSGLHEGKGVNRMGIASFFGGCMNSHAARQEEWALFDDFVVWRYTEKSAEPTGNTHSAPGRSLEVPHAKSEQARHATGVATTSHLPASAQ